ncbi:unnamed protein product [Cylicocyclus nassatus]|uniref:Uncharacterized protein n=1 Tax=Cylicocyclus nassatus TaxID=53992 RepID=A0AA36DMK9_CYLNA|nr:unnamed protein product [Cylicocyclus nassatus]
MEFAFVLMVLACNYIEGNLVGRNSSDHTEVTKENATNATTSAHFAAVTPLERRMLDGSADSRERRNYDSQTEPVRAYGMRVSGIENGDGDDDTSKDDDDGKPLDDDTGFYDGPLDEGVDDFSSKASTVHLHFTAMSPKSRAIVSRMLSLLSEEVGKFEGGSSGFGSNDAESDVRKKAPCTRKHLHLAVEELKWGCRGVMEFYDKVCKKDYANCIRRRKKRRCIPQ